MRHSSSRRRARRRSVDGARRCFRGHIRSGARRSSRDRARGPRIRSARPRALRPRAAISAEGPRPARECRRPRHHARGRDRGRAPILAVAGRARARRRFLHGRHARDAAFARRALSDPRKRRAGGSRALADTGSDPRASDSPCRGATWCSRAGPRAPRTRVRRPAARYQCSRAARPCRSRDVPALPCSRRSVGAHTETALVSVTGSASVGHHR